MNGLHRGMSLVELLVALSLGALLMLAASTMLLAASGSYGDQSASARLDDNGPMRSTPSPAPCARRLT